MEVIKEDDDDEIQDVQPEAKPEFKEHFFILQNKKIIQFYVSLVAN